VRAPVASDPFLVGVLFGFVPAMGFLYILLNQYQAFFEEKRVFKTFFVGLLAGLFVTILEQFLGPGGLPGADTAGTAAWGSVILFAYLFGLLETAVAMAVLNWRTYRGRRDTPFYGAALGLGIGAVAAVFAVGSAVGRATQGTSGIEEVALVTLIGLYFMGAILVRAGAAVWIGQGTAEGDLFAAGFRATVAIGTYTLLLFSIFLLPAYAANVVPPVALVAAIVFISYILRHVLDRVVPEEVLREAGIHRRRMARRRMREGHSAEEPEDAGAGLEDDAVPKERRE
jgi:hypothetical protein